MTIPLPTCDVLPAPPEPLVITLPGGAAITSIPTLGSLVSTELDLTSSILAQLSPALAALQPFMRLLDVVTSIMDVLQAVPEVPVDPTGFLEALADLAEKVSRLAPLLPPVSLPATIAGAITTVARLLASIVSVLEDVVAAQARVVAAIEEATQAGDAELVTRLECEQAQVVAMGGHALAALGPIQPLLNTLTGLLSFLPGAVTLPAMPDVTGQALGPVVEALQVVVAALEAIQIPGA